VGLFDRLKPENKQQPQRRDPADRAKHAGAVEYEARHLDRLAERLESLGRHDEARTRREEAAALRESVRPGRR
jgi:hypothetical protein